MDDALIQTLLDYGFFSKEAKIYLTTLELGSAPASTIWRRANIKRITAYSTLQDFKSRNIAYSVERAEVSHFSVIEPQKLLASLEQKYLQFKEAVPQLEAIVHSNAAKPQIRYFEGVQWLKTMYTDLLTSEIEISSFLWTHASDKHLLDRLYNEFLPQRISKKISAKVILPYTQEDKDYVAQDKKALKISKMVKAEGFDIPNEINLYGPDKISIALFNEKEMLGIIIQSPSLYTSLKSIFDLLRSTL